MRSNKTFPISVIRSFLCIQYTPSIVSPFSMPSNSDLSFFAADDWSRLPTARAINIIEFRLHHSGSPLA